MHWKKSMVFSGSFKTSTRGRCNVLSQGCNIEYTSQTQGFRPEPQTGKACCLWDTWILIGTSTLVTFPWLSVLFLTNTAHHLNSNICLLQQNGFPEHANRLLQANSRATVPAAQTRVGIGSTQPHSQLAPSDILCRQSQQPGDHLSSGGGMVAYWGDGWWPAAWRPGKGKGTTVTHSAAILQEDWAVLWCNGSCSHSWAKLVTLSGAASCL